MQYSNHCFFPSRVTKHLYQPTDINVKQYMKEVIFQLQRHHQNNNSATLHEVGEHQLSYCPYLKITEANSVPSLLSLLELIDKSILHW